MSEKLIEQAENLLHQRKLAAAIAKFDQAQQTADRNRCASGRWLAHMLAGNFEAAWKESDAIRASGSPDPHRFWSGEDLTGKRAILRCLHGFGDAVQFFRYIHMLREGTASFVIEVPPRLVELASYFRGVEEVVTWGSNAPKVPPTWDVQIEVNELPYIFRTELSQLPIAERYLQLPKSLSSMFPARAANQESFKVGVVWASGGWNPARSVPFESIRSLLDISGCEFWNLQGGQARREWSPLKAKDHLHNADECSENLVALAALIQQLDFIITPDTLAAHLGGALGVPVCLMLERAADWRWMHGRSDSPWYPTLKIFRQQHDGDWTSVVEQVKDVLRQRVVQHRTSRMVA